MFHMFHTFQYPDGNIPYFSIKIWMFQFWPSTKESPILEASNYHPILPCFILAIRWLHVQSRIRGHLQTNIWLFIVISLAKSKNLAKIYGKPLAKSMNIYSYFSGKIYEQSGKNLWKTWVYLSLLVRVPGISGLPGSSRSWAQEKDVLDVVCATNLR